MEVFFFSLVFASQAENKLTYLLGGDLKALLRAEKTDITYCIFRGLTFLVNLHYHLILDLKVLVSKQI